jgi:adenylate cyclase
MDCPICATPNPPGHRYCRSCGTALGVLLSSDSERRYVTVLFADMTGSTAMSERLDPEEVQEIMSEFYQELAACVHRYGGTVDKFLGDGIMALFGAPRAHEDDPERALAAALEMREGVEAINRRLVGRLPQRIGIHIGVNTGLVVAGRVGGGGHSAYTVLGDTVNVAARLEDQSQDGQILVSDATRQRTEHVFAFRELPPVQVKGKAEPIKVWELLGWRARRRPPRKAGLEAPLVGREPELARLRTAIGSLSAGTGGLVVLTGQAGLGKSRLLHEARTEAIARGLRWVEAACPSVGLGGTLAVWGELMRRLLGVDEAPGRSIALTIPSPETPGAPGTRVVSLQELRDASGALAALLGLGDPPEERRHTGPLDAEAERNRLFLAVQETIAAHAREQPLILAIDDLHWIDSASMQLLARVLTVTAQAPLLIITAFRSDTTTVQEPLAAAVAHAAPPLHITLELQPLSEEHSARLAEALLGQDPRLADVRVLLVQSSDGNPLFLEEVLRTLIDQGVLRPEGGRWERGADRDEVVVPDTLQGLLLDRIDRLPESSKRAVQIAAVIGRRFPARLLGDILGLRGDPTPLLAPLEQAGILERVANAGTDGVEYRFRHTLMQEAAYASLLHKHRQAYHRRVAAWYERQAGTRPPPGVAAILAHHYDRAEALPEAARWTLAAGDEARRAFALDEARDHYTRARHLAEQVHDGETHGRALAGLGEIAVAEGALEAAVEQFTRALELVRDPLERAVIERRRGQVQDRLGLHAAALAAFSRAAAILGEERPGEPPEWRAERGRLRVARAYAHLNRGDEDAARAAAEAAVRAELDPVDRADAAALLGAAYLQRGEAALAVQHFAEALALARAAGDLLREAAALEQLGRAYRAANRLDEARQALTACSTLRRRLSDEAGCGAVLIELGRLDEYEGAFAQAEAHLREAVALADHCDDPVTKARASLYLGRVRRYQGDWAGARQALERAGLDDPELAGRVSLELALLALARHESPEAELRRILAAAEGHGAADIAAQARLGLAAIARRQGRPAEARALLRQLLATPPRDADAAQAATAARLELAELALQEGRPDAAVVAARMALAAAEATGPALLRWRAQRLLGTALARGEAWEEAERLFSQATAAARAAGAFPELARCLDAWTRARPGGGAHGTPSPERQARMAELRAVLAYLAGGARPAGTAAEATSTSGV